MTEKDCAPSPEIACKMLPCDFSANIEASQEDVFVCSILTEDSGRVEVSGPVDDDTVDDCSREEDLIAVLSHSEGKVLRGKSGHDRD